MTLKHRNDIDGLRAVAVLPVLFFHAKIWPFSSGYVGVDIFFVISGYLISGVILRECRVGRFSIIDFYDRRIRRILPALAVILAASSAAAMIILMPDELLDFGKYLLSAVLFSANILYWHNAKGYFVGAAADNPLLHVWSLSVEEQFYVLWPLLLIVLAKAKKAMLPIVIAALAMISLGIAFFTARTNPNMAFFLLHTRAWELMAGAFLAAGGMDRIRTPLIGKIFAALGLLLCLTSLIAFDPSAPFPGWPSVLATLGAILLLHAGETGATPVGALLGSAIPRRIGQISYSLYLWHWPLLVFPRLLLNRELLVAERLAALAVAFFLAVLSWAFVEQPFRRRAAFFGKMPASFLWAAAVGLALAAIAIVAWRGHGLPGRLAPDVRTLVVEAGNMGAAGERDCLADQQPTPDFTGSGCLFGPGSAARQAVIWGDSFADALTPGLVDFSAEHGMALREVTQGLCLPLPDLLTFGKNDIIDRICQTRNHAIEKAILSDDRTKLVILDGMWHFFEGSPDSSRVVDDNGKPLSHAAAQKTFAQALDHLVSQLVSGGKQVLIIGPVPDYTFQPLHCIGRGRMFGITTAYCDSKTANDEAASSSNINMLIEQIVARHSNARAFFPEAVFCDKQSCHTYLDGHLLYHDSGHLNGYGANRVGNSLQAALKNWAVGN